MTRHLDWDGCHNVRDLGGLPTTGGRHTRFGAVVRAGSLDRLTPEGWARLIAYGVRTVIDLREDDERSPDAVRPDGIEVVSVPLDDNADSAFWDRIIDDDVDGTPLYYRPFLDHKADRCVTALRAVASAGPGGVVVHCGIGRDRTGLLSLLFLALAGVGPEAVAEDYALSGERLKLHFGDDRDPVAERLGLQGTTVAAVMTELFASGLVERLRQAGLTDAEQESLRARLIGTGDDGY
ncbi:tyrosine-protein phosphatase [Actinoplanes sp. G11-F43]|uniref:tyrosine-protein phosphatase n=1 Tax=Actinoplanes sp. G11-F43 TaxID=3424130 RepID=UPI003D3288B1